MKSISIAVVLAAALAASGCTPPGEGGMTKETGGTLIGAGAGAITGAQFGKGKGQLLGVAIGTIAGALIGREVGRSLDEADRLAMERTAQVALEKNRTGDAAEWTNPDSGHAGTITPTRTYQEASGAYCREYQQTVTIGGQQQSAYGTACRQPDGTWKIVK